MSTNVPCKPVQGYDGYYVISCCGAVRSIDRLITLPNGDTRQVKGKVLSSKINNDGYRFVSLSKDGVTHTKYIHILVAQAFIPNPDGLPEVNHLSGDKSDNNVGNLEWISHAGNVQHAYDHGLSSNKGGGHYFAVSVTDNSLGMKYETIMDWAIARGIPYSTARNILSGNNKTRIIDLSQIVLTKKNNTNAK